MLTAKEAQRFSGETVITDVPRLNKDESGCVQLSVGDLSFPCVGYYCEKKKTGFLLFFEQKNELGNFGITVEENLILPFSFLISAYLMSPLLPESCGLMYL